MFPLVRAFLRRLTSMSALLQLLFTLLPLSTSCAAAASLKTSPEGGSDTLQIDSPERLLHDHTQPHFAPGRSGIVELFEWKFADIAAECEQFLGPNGYAGVQVSPVTEHVVVRADTLQRPWWERYQPISYRIATRSGDEPEFSAMTRACNAAGVRVYVDVVLNHMAGAYDEQTARGGELLTGTAGSTANVSAYDYPAVPYTRADFHKPCTLDNYADAHVVRNCQWERCPDLDHYRLHVRGQLTELLNRLVELGAAGFRVDGAKYIWPIDVKLIFKEVQNLNSEEFDFPENSRPFVYQSVVDMGIDSVSKTEYTSYGAVSDYLYAAELATILSGKAPLSTLINWGPAMGFLPHQNALVFVDSHDGQRVPQLLGRNRLLSYKRPRGHIMATLFMLTHPYGRVQRLMSSYYFAAAQPDQGPPVHEDDDELIRAPEFDAVSGQCTRASGWVCEHRWPPIVRMMALVNTLHDVEDGVINFQTDGPSHVSFCRGRKAFIALNSDLQLAYAAKVQTCLTAGIYCDAISGGRSADGADCVGKRVVVDADGYAEIQLPIALHLEMDESGDYADGEDDAVDNIDWSGEFGVLAIYEGARLEGGADAEEPVPEANAEEPVEGASEQEPAPSVSAEEPDAEELVPEADAEELVPEADAEAPVEGASAEKSASAGEPEETEVGEAELENEDDVVASKEGLVTKDVSPEEMDDEAFETEKNARMEDAVPDASVEQDESAAESEGRDGGEPEESEVGEAVAEDETNDDEGEESEKVDEEEDDGEEEEEEGDEEEEDTPDAEDDDVEEDDGNDEQGDGGGGGEAPGEPAGEAEGEAEGGAEGEAEGGAEGEGAETADAEQEAKDNDAESEKDESEGVAETDIEQNDEPAREENNESTAINSTIKILIGKAGFPNSDVNIHNSLHYGSLAIAPITILFNLRVH